MRGLDAVPDPAHAAAFGLGAAVGHLQDLQLLDTAPVRDFQASLDRLEKFVIQLHLQENVHIRAFVPKWIAAFKPLSPTDQVQKDMRAELASDLRFLEDEISHALT
jgi:hypothetical protein